jgi:hypothetical protein
MCGSNFYETDVTFMKDPGLNKPEHFIVYKISLPMTQLNGSIAIWLFFDSFWPHCAARI